MTPSLGICTIERGVGPSGPAEVRTGCGLIEAMATDETMSNFLAVNQGDFERKDRLAPVVGFRDGPARWLARQDWKDRLVGPGSPDWFTLEADPGAVPIKTGRDRIVWRVSLPEGSIYAKVAEPAGPVSKLKNALLGDALRREWRSSLRAQVRGVPVVRCLALGERDGKPSRVVLLSEGVAGAEALLDAWHRRVERAEPNRRNPAAQALIAAASRLFALSHDRGFLHGDAHPNNVLIRWVEGEQPEALFLDVPFARLTRGSVKLRQSLQSLAQLDQYFHRRATRVDRLRFLRAYLAQRSTLFASYRTHSGLRQVLQRLRRASARHAERLARTRDRRLRRNGHYFHTFRLNDGWRVTVALRLERRHVFPEPAVPDRSPGEWRTMLQPLIAKLGPTRARRIALEHHGYEIEWVRVRRPWTKLIGLLRGSPHRRAFERCHKQRHRDKRSELILGYAERRQAGLIDVTILIRPLPKAWTER